MIQEVRQEILLKNGEILYTGDLVKIEYKLDEDEKMKCCTGKIKDVEELFIKLDTSKRYKASEIMIYSWELKSIGRISDKNE
ncbi:hypothetical protein QEW_0700 [Clostridioides difficile CD160]|nr:hypothetical protein QEW_0700 [Clostridioides difficile CD160]MDI7818083.1 hypothetical protein [Clostridioides difficile]NJI80606.1 hypothetical protein [Clostridioides difficile]NJJ37093.1 hypothetical protein [Clostridioides difficile]NJK16091.1 hypothetical protein [Clostridioides difficile]